MHVDAELLALGELPIEAVQAVAPAGDGAERRRGQHGVVVEQCLEPNARAVDDHVRRRRALDDEVGRQCIGTCERVEVELEDRGRRPEAGRHRSVPQPGLLVATGVVATGEW